MELAKSQLVTALQLFVMEHGEEMSDYYYNEFGMYEEDEEGVKILKVLNVSDTGCCFACQRNVNDDTLEDLQDEDERLDALSEVFYHYTIWSIYAVREKDKILLKYYMFCNDGVYYTEDSDPDHGYVDTLSLADLSYIYKAVINMFK